MKKRIDARGLDCPRPVVLAKDALESMGQCRLLEVMTDNDTAVKNIMKFARSRGLEVSYRQNNTDEYCVAIALHSDASTVENRSSEDSESSSDFEAKISDKIAIFASESMGIGSEDLGKTLMKNFIYALTQMETIPSTAVFYNGGVTLVTENSPALEDLKLLESMGMEILVCGTCLKYYEVEGKQRVGTVTNMYEIVDRMVQGGELISP